MSTVLSLFSGIGGIDLGFIQAGFEVIWSNEKDLAACKTYKYNFPNVNLINCDISKINITNIPKTDIIVAGFPCQPFSKAGLQKGFKDSRGNMFFEIAKIAEAKMPRIIFLENVDNLLNHDNGNTFLVIFNTLASLGYSLRYKIMSANDYCNLPQTRSRIFIIAFLYDEDCDKFEYPPQIPLTKKIFDIINIKERKNDIYYYSPNCKIYNYLNTKIYDNSSIYRITDTSVRKVSNNMCPTLTANMGTFPNRVPIIRDSYGIRKLTLRECLDFQGFPNGFYFPKSITINDAYKQIGNSVCVPLIKEIALNIKKVL